MNNKPKFFVRISNSALLILIIFLIFFKIIIYILLKNQVININLGGGSDAEYYHRYAQGSINVAVNIWPIILRYLNDYNFYSRNFISYLFLIIDLAIIPIIVCKLSGLNFRGDQKYYFYLLLVCLIYPTLYFYTLDVYRDVFMVFIFLIGCYIVKLTVESSNFFYFSLTFILSILIGFFLLALRPYLGYAFLLSLILWKLKFTRKKILLLGTLYFIALFTANYVGALESITDYRTIFDEASGGSTLGLDFSNDLLFIPNFFLSLFGQMFGLYITNPLAVIILLVETIPFIYMLIYVIKNIKLADNFLRFLIIFFVLYASVWLIGNDNLGTALRLRIYNYLAIYICFFHIVKLKKNIKLKEYKGV